MDGHEMAEVVGAVGLFVFATTVATVIIVQLFTTMRARAALTREAEFRDLAATAVAAQESIDRRLSDQAERLAAIERILKQVE
jgi:cell division protein FtsL